MSTPAPPALEARDLTVSAGTTTLVSGVGFTLARGGCLGVLGASGAGKTSLARALAGWVPRGTQVGGSLRVGGVEVLGGADGRWAQRHGARVGLAHQDADATLAPHRRLGAQFNDVLHAAGVADRAAAGALAIDWCERVGIADAHKRLRQYPFELSGGLRLRAALALSLAARPAVLVADEPTAALDPALALEVAALLAQACADGAIALVVISHDLGLLAGLTDELLVLADGRVVEQGPTGAIYARPADPRTEALLGAARARSAP